MEHGYDYHAMQSAFQKLAELSGDEGKKSLKASHPGAGDRAKQAKARADKQDAAKK